MNITKARDFLLSICNAFDEKVEKSTLHVSQDMYNEIRTWLVLESQYSEEIEFDFGGVRFVIINEGAK